MCDSRRRDENGELEELRCPERRSTEASLLELEAALYEAPAPSIRRSSALDETAMEATLLDQEDRAGVTDILEVDSPVTSPPVAAAAAVAPATLDATAAPGVADATESTVAGTGSEQETADRVVDDAMPPAAPLPKATALTPAAPLPKATAVLPAAPLPKATAVVPAAPLPNTTALVPWSPLPKATAAVPKAAVTAPVASVRPQASVVTPVQPAPPLAPAASVAPGVPVRAVPKHIPPVPQQMPANYPLRVVRNAFQGKCGAPLFAAPRYFAARAAQQSPSTAAA